MDQFPLPNAALSPCLVLLLLGLPLLSGCEGNDLHTAEMKNTPEAYEEFLIKHPQSDKADEIATRIDELRFTRAKRDKKAASFLEYLDKHPMGAYVEEASKAADELSFKEAEETNTEEAYGAYLGAFSDGAFADQAKQLAAQLAYRSQVSVEDIRLAKINLARDPKGELNGWELQARVRNNGDEKLRVVEIAIDLMGPDGAALRTDNYWAVAPDLGGFPTPEWMKPTLGARGTREIVWTTGDIPKGWNQQMTVRITRVEFRTR